MRSLLAGWLALAACGYPRPADVSDTQRISGHVHGLWDGADGVTLRLQADGVDTLLSVAANGGFEFARPGAGGRAYTGAGAAQPAGPHFHAGKRRTGTASGVAPPPGR